MEFRWQPSLVVSLQRAKQIQAALEVNPKLLELFAWYPVCMITYLHPSCCLCQYTHVSSRPLHWRYILQFDFLRPGLEYDSPPSDFPNTSSWYFGALFLSKYLCFCSWEQVREGAKINSTGVDGEVSCTNFSTSFLWTNGCMSVVAQSCKSTSFSVSFVTLFRVSKVRPLVSSHCLSCSLAITDPFTIEVARFCFTWFTCVGGCVTSGWVIVIVTGVWVLVGLVIIVVAAGWVGHRHQWLCNCCGVGIFRVHGSPYWDLWRKTFRHCLLTLKQAEHMPGWVLGAK